MSRANLSMFEADLSASWLNLQRILNFYSLRNLASNELFFLTGGVKMAKISVIGSGGWGIALAILLHKNGHNLTIWSFDKKEAEELKITRENKTKLPNILLPEDIKVTSDLKEAVDDKDILIPAVPSKVIRSVSISLKDIIKDNQIIVNVAKGLEIATKKRISEIVAEELENKEYSYVLLAGPTHAEEVAQKLPSAILSVYKNEEAAKIVQTTFSNLYFRVYTGTDLMGAELAGALKNCLAIAAGIADGMGYGDNTKAALITRGINEMFEIAKFYNANPKTFMGLSGLGDIIVTCTSKHSRNRYVGEKLGQGQKIEDIVSHMNMVSEGAETIKALYKIIKENNLKAPIFTALYEVIYGGKPVSELESTFMSRDLKSEFLN